MNVLNLKIHELISFFSIFFLQRLYLCRKNPEDSEACLLAYLYGEIKRDKIHVIGCAACVNSQSPLRNGYPGIPDWTNEQDELSSVIPQGTEQKCRDPNLWRSIKNGETLPFVQPPGMSADHPPPPTTTPINRSSPS